MSSDLEGALGYSLCSVTASFLTTGSTFTSFFISFFFGGSGNTGAPKPGAGTGTGMTGGCGAGAVEWEGVGAGTGEGS